MITVSQAVSEIIQSDELASESLRSGLLNLSAYAGKIQKRIENITFKEVKTGTIVVALSRLTKTLTPDLRKILTNQSPSCRLACQINVLLPQ